MYEKGAWEAIHQLPKTRLATARNRDRLVGTQTYRRRLRKDPPKASASSNSSTEPFLWSCY